jgi:hypothetical protein
VRREARRPCIEPCAYYIQSAVWLIDEYSVVSAEMLEELDRLGKKVQHFPCCSSTAIWRAVGCTGEAMGIELQGVGGGGGTGEPIKLQGFAGSHTRPARPPEAKLRRTAGGLHFFGGELR